MYPYEQVLYITGRILLGIVSSLVVSIVSFIIVILMFILIVILWPFLSLNIFIILMVYIPLIVGPVLLRIIYLIKFKHSSKLERINVATLILDYFGLEVVMKIIEPTPFKNMEKMLY